MSTADPHHGSSLYPRCLLRHCAVQKQPSSVGGTPAVFTDDSNPQGSLALEEKPREESMTPHCGHQNLPKGFLTSNDNEIGSYSFLLADKLWCKLFWKSIQKEEVEGDKNAGEYDLFSCGLFSNQ